jgi:hypothetical protein
MEDGLKAIRIYLTIKALEPLMTREGVIKAMIETPQTAQLRSFQ